MCTARGSDYGLGYAICDFGSQAQAQSPSSSFAQIMIMISLRQSNLACILGVGIPSSGDDSWRSDPCLDVNTPKQGSEEPYI